MASHPGDRGLTERQAKFARHYVATKNGTLSAKLAGYAAPHSPVGSKLLRIPVVAQEIARLAQAHAREAGGMLRDAVDTAARLAPLDGKRDQIARELLDEMSQQVADTLARHWLTATMVRNLRMSMAELPFRTSALRTRKRGAPPVLQTVETYKRDPSAATATARLLYEELDRMERRAASTASEKEGQPGSANPEKTLGTRLLERHLAAFRRPGEAENTAQPSPQDDSFDDEAEGPSAKPDS